MVKLWHFSYKKNIRNLLATCVLSVFIFTSCNEEKQKNKITSEADNEKEIILNEEKYGPFFTFYNGEDYVITASIENEDMHNYLQLFNSYNLSGNGYTWEGIITQIIENEDKTLINFIQFDSEAGAFYAYTNNQKNQQKFINIVKPYFSDTLMLSNFLQKADLSKIDD